MQMHIYRHKNSKLETSVTDRLTLVSIHLCPYVQRAAIALAEKNVPFERRYVDLANKPDWFKQASPLGKVPLLLVDDQVLFESNVIVEYLEETEPHRLHPVDPLTKARHRAWMEFGSTILGDLWVIETTKDQIAFDAKVKAMREKFERMEDVLGDGPYFAGASFSVVDCVFAPIFRYFDVFDDIRDLGLFAGLPKVKAWRKALSERPSVRSAVVPEYGELLRQFLKKHDGVLAQGWSSSSQL
jgi:glutathione S-transferase